MLNDMLANWNNAASLRELAAVIIVLLLSSLLARALRAHSGLEPHKLQREGARRLAFPLLAVALLTLLRFLAHRLGLAGDLIGIAIELALAMAGVRIAVFALRQVVGASSALASYERTLATVIWLGVALNLVGILSDFIVWLDGFVLHLGKGHITVWQVLQGVVTVVVTVVLALWLGGVAEARLQAAEGLDASLRVVLSRIIKALLLFIAVLLGMSFAGLDITTLSVFGGALGVGLGFGMQKIASNYVSGFIILLDRSIRIGNLIQVGPDQRGEVMQITTRYTVLRSPNGPHIIVPNEMMIGSVVQNETFGVHRVRVSVQIMIAQGADYERALSILEEVAVATERVLQEPAPRAYLADVTDQGLRLELASWIGDPLKGALEVRSNIQRVVLARFAREGIELAKSASATPATPVRS